MPEPQYPTKKGLWSEGTRPETEYANVRFGMPYPKAIKNFRAAISDRGDFDPAVLFVWGTMQATGVLNILKSVEEKFGAEGQEIVRQAINDAGYEACKGMLDNSEFPKEASDTELLSFIVTGLNTILYASLEDPHILNQDECDFDILWCPHQDRYTAFDCRVQRYFVEGMIKAIEEYTGTAFNAEVTRLIPRGSDHCHFEITRRNPEDDTHPWNQYSNQLARRALDKLKE